MSKKNKRASIIASAVVGAGLAIGASTAGILIANQPLDVTYYANNGTPAVIAQIKKGDNAKLPTPTREGYNFVGWYLDTALTQQVTSANNIKQNSKLYAGWELANYELATANSIDTQAETAGLKSIGKYAFANCTNLKTITIPETVTSIGDGAFNGCNLTNLYINSNVYALATSLSALGGSLNATKNVYVKEEIENATYNNFMLTGTNFYYQETANGYVHFTTDSEQEKKFTITFKEDNNSLLEEQKVRYRGTAHREITAKENITSDGVYIKMGQWVSSIGDDTETTLVNIKEDRTVFASYAPEVKATLNQCSWKTIKTVSESKLATNCFAVGDEKVITINDTTKNLTFDLTVQIADFDHDIDSEGNTIGITFITKELLPSVYNHNMNATSTNSGSWAASGMRAYLNTTIFELLPHHLQVAIGSSLAMKKTMTGGAPPVLGATAEDKLFLLANVEINDKTTWNYYKDEGTTYALCSTWTDADRIKYYADSGRANSWWARTPMPASTSVNFVSQTGYVSGTSATASLGICFGFCL